MASQRLAASNQNEIDAARLAHKRALDRKSQNAKRERTKLQVQSLQQQLASQEERLKFLVRENERLNAENSRLQDKLSMVPSDTSTLNVHCGDGTSEVGSALQADLSRLAGNSYSEATAVESSPQSVVQQRTSSIFDVISSTPVMHGQGHPPVPQQLFQALPCNTSPVCLSDQILDTFIKTNSLSQVQNDNIQLRCDRPNVIPLIMQESDARIHPTLRVVSDVLRAFTDIETLPEQVAGLYLMFRLFNWRMFPTRQSYEEIPGWLRPIPLQLRVPHPAWMDSIPWPRVRSHLISRQDQYDFESFAAYYSSALTVSWPYNDADAIHATSVEELVASPIFDQHWQKLRNWKVRSTFREKFPVISDIINSELNEL